MISRTYCKPVSQVWWEHCKPGVVGTLSIDDTKSQYSNHNWSTIYFPIHKKEKRHIKILFCIILKQSLPKRSKNSKYMLLLFKTSIFRFLWKMLNFYQKVFLGKKLLHFTLFWKKGIQNLQKKTKQYRKKKFFESWKKSWTHDGILLVSRSGNPARCVYSIVFDLFGNGNCVSVKQVYHVGIVELFL